MPSLTSSNTKRHRMQHLALCAICCASTQSKRPASRAQRAAMVRARLEGEDLMGVISTLNKHNLVLMGVVQRLLRIGLHREMQGRDTLGKVVARLAVVGDWHQ